MESFSFVRPHQEVGLSGRRSVIVDNIKTASENPPDAKFHFHNEYARSAHYPELIFFWSQKVPEQGFNPFIQIYDTLLILLVRRPNAFTLIIGTL